MSLRPVSDDFSNALEYVQLQMQILNELDSIAAQETEDVVSIIFQRVLRATQEFRRAYGEKEYVVLDEATIPLKRTESRVDLQKSTELKFV